MKSFSKKTVLSFICVFAMALSFASMSYTSKEVETEVSTEDQLASNWCSCSDLREALDGVVAQVPASVKCEIIDDVIRSYGSGCAWDCNIFSTDYGCYAGQPI